MSDIVTRPSVCRDLDVSSVSVCLIHFSELLLVVKYVVAICCSAEMVIAGLGGRCLTESKEKNFWLLVCQNIA